MKWFCDGASSVVWGSGDLLSSMKMYLRDDLNEKFFISQVFCLELASYTNFFSIN